jgi:hypothetical protein
MSNRSPEPPENWQRVVSAAKATSSQKSSDAPTRPPTEFSHNLLGRVRAFHASLAAWQRWSLLAGLVSILLFVASLIYLKNSAPTSDAPIIDTPGIDLPKPPPPPKN